MSTKLTRRFNIPETELDIVSKILFGTQPSNSVSDLPDIVTKPDTINESVRNMSVSDENIRSGPDSVNINKTSPGPSISNIRKAPTKTIKSGSIVPIKKELSADELNAMSLNVAKGIDTDTGAAVDNIRKRIKALNTTEEVKKPAPFTSQETAPIKKEPEDFKLIPGEDAKKVKDKKPVVKFEEFDSSANIEIVEAEAGATHTGKIKSSKRILKTLQLAAEKDTEVPFQFENGTTAAIQPALAKIAIAYYNKLSEFEKAEAAKIMRKSFKDFLTITKRK